MSAKVDNSTTLPPIDPSGIDRLTFGVDAKVKDGVVTLDSVCFQADAVRKVAQETPGVFASQLLRFVVDNMPEHRKGVHKYPSHAVGDGPILATAATRLSMLNEICEQFHIPNDRYGRVWDLAVSRFRGGKIPDNEQTLRALLEATAKDYLVHGAKIERQEAKAQIQPGIEAAQDKFHGIKRGRFFSALKTLFLDKLHLGRGAALNALSEFGNQEGILAQANNEWDEVLTNARAARHDEWEKFVDGIKLLGGPIKDTVGWALRSPKWAVRGHAILAGQGLGALFAKHVADPLRRLRDNVRTGWKKHVSEPFQERVAKPFREKVSEPIQEKVVEPGQARIAEAQEGWQRAREKGVRGLADDANRSIRSRIASGLRSWADRVLAGAPPAELPETTG